MQGGQDAQGMAAVGVGEDHLALRVTMKEGGEGGVRGEHPLDRDIVDEGEKFGFVDAAGDLEAAQGGAVGEEELVAEGGNLLPGEVQTLMHVEVNALADERPHPGGGGVKRVIEINKEGSNRHR